MIEHRTGQGTVSIGLEFAASFEQRQRRRMIQGHVLDRGVEISIFEDAT